MPSITDIPPELTGHPSRVNFLKWLASLQLNNDRLEHSIIKIYSNATGLYFNSLDMKYLAELRTKTRTDTTKK